MGVYICYLNREKLNQRLFSHRGTLRINALDDAGLTGRCSSISCENVTQWRVLRRLHERDLISFAANAVRLDRVMGKQYFPFDEYYSSSMRHT